MRLTILVSLLATGGVAAAQQPADPAERVEPFCGPEWNVGGCPPSANIGSGYQLMWHGYSEQTWFHSRQWHQTPGQNTLGGIAPDAFGSNTAGGILGDNTPGGISGDNSPSGISGDNSPGGISGDNSPGGVSGNNAIGGVSTRLSPGQNTIGGIAPETP